jgi:hypothetical protein
MVFSKKIYFFCRAKHNFFFQNLTFGYMTKTLNQIIIFFLHQNQNIFFSNIGNQNIFLEKTITHSNMVLFITVFHEIKDGINIQSQNMTKYYFMSLSIYAF